MARTHAGRSARAAGLPGALVDTTRDLGRDRTASNRLSESRGVLVGPHVEWWKLANVAEDPTNLRRRRMTDTSNMGNW